MKKTLVIGFLSCSLFLTGCSEKKLVCKYKSTDSFQGVNEINYKITFDDKDKMSTMTINSVSIYGDAYINSYSINMNDELTSAKDVCLQFEQYDNSKCTALLDDKKITLTIKHNIAKMSDDDKKELGFQDSDTLTYNKVKEQYESNGFTCR